MKLLRKALEEGIEPTVTSPEPASIAEGNQPNNTETNVIMSGPLGQAYTQALAIAFSKPEIVEGAPVTTETVSEATALESQANDAIMAAGAINAFHGSDADAIEDPQALIYGVKADSVNDQTIVDVVEQMTQFEINQPEEFIVVVDATDMVQNSGEDTPAYAEAYMSQPINDANLEKSAVIPVLESMVVRMGGRVVYSLKQAIECLSNIEHEEVIPGVEEVPVEVIPAEQIENPEAIAPAGTDVSEPAESTEVTISVESYDEEETLHDQLKKLQAQIEGSSPEQVNKTSMLKSIVAMLSLESEKGGKKKDEKKKKENPKAKLNRAKAVLQELLPSIKDSSQRAKIHYAMGIIGSAQKDIPMNLAKESLSLEGQSGWGTFFKILSDVLDTARVQSIINNLKQSKRDLESLEGRVRRGAATDNQIVNQCDFSAKAEAKGLSLIDELMTELRKLQTEGKKLAKK